MKRRAVLVLNPSIDRTILNVKQLIKLDSKYSIYGLDSSEIDFFEDQTNKKLEFIALPEFVYDFNNDITLSKLKEDVEYKNSVLECLKITLPIDKCPSYHEISTFLKLDNEIWTSFLSQQEGYINKFVLQEHPISKTYKYNEIYLFCIWSSLACWKQIKEEDMVPVDKVMYERLGYTYQLQPIPDENGFKLH